MSARYDCADTQQRDEGLAAAASAVADGQLVVLPTDTVYGVGADAFNPAAVSAFRYLVRLINDDHVAPPAADTTDDFIAVIQNFSGFECFGFTATRAAGLRSAGGG